MFSERDLHALRNGMNVLFKPFGVRGKVSTHAVQRSKERGQTFELNDLVFSLAAFKDQEKDKIKQVMATNSVWRGVIKDHRNFINIPFDLNGRLPGFFTIVTVMRLNPDRFKNDEPWREKEWVHIR